VLLALCKAAPNIHAAQSAQRLSYQLAPYILEAPTQTFVASPFFRQIDPSPTESLAFHVTAALLVLGLNSSDLQETIHESLFGFLNNCTRTADSVLSPHASDPDNLHLSDAIRTLTVVLALIGFMDAASAQADFWQPGSRLALAQKIRHLISEPFMVAVETALSTIRNSQSQEREAKEWKRLVRHYAASERPLGAMLLQRSVMWLVVSSASLLVTDGSTLRSSHILDWLTAHGASLKNRTLNDIDGDLHSVEVYTALSVEQMHYIESGADFMRLGTVAQQKLAFDVKSAALLAFMNCTVLNQEVANLDNLVNWLQETLEDSFQMADETLACIVLKSLALVCRLSPSLSSTISQLLPRFLVQGATQGKIVSVASESLAFVLKLLSKDAIISTLYALGNVLSTETDTALANGQPNGTAGGEQNLYSIYGNRHSVASAISLRVNGEEETAIVYGNVVQAICGITVACDDEKITALAQSMLVQKFNKVNAIVDAQIITGAATLALNSAQLEFRSLLKMYAKMCHEGIVEGKDYLLEAVSKSEKRLFVGTLGLSSYRSWRLALISRQI
jgi:phosphatidylinositol 4-kinase A